MNDHIEKLEDRRLLSGSVTETEPNNSRAKADVITRTIDRQVQVSGGINTLGDQDWFKIQLKAGDVVGAAMDGKDGLDTVLRLVDGSGKLLIANDDSETGTRFLGPDSPLPRSQGAEQNAAVQYVISRAGTYYVEVSAFENASTGPYALDLLVARPGMEAKPVGTKQILFVDFDGAKVDFGDYYEAGTTAVTQLSPLSQSLAGWGLTDADEDAVIDLVIAKLTNRLSTYLGANGLNGNFASTGIPGQFGIDIRNSRDHDDEFDQNPLVSRVVIGALKPKFSELTPIGIAQYIDVGNFSTDDDSLVNINFIAGALAAIPIQPPATTVDFVAHAIATLAGHEAGHIFGCFHTAQSPDDIFAGVTNAMDPDQTTTAGPDLVFGTADDDPLHFGVDGYELGAILGGVNDTLNTVAFGLSTGRGTLAFANTQIRSISAAFTDARLVDRTWSVRSVLASDASEGGEDELVML